jgi:hypothetical protein
MSFLPTTDQQPVMVRVFFDFNNSVFPIPQNGRKILQSFRIRADHFQYLSRLHAIEPAFGFDDAPGATPPLQIQNPVDLMFIFHILIRI